MNQIPLLTQYIIEKKLDSVQKLDCALNYLLNNVGRSIDFHEFDNACGIGIIISLKEIEIEVEKYINKYKNEIIEKRFVINYKLELIIKI
jgi:glutaminyl-tRNA synthetase